MRRPLVLNGYAKQFDAGNIGKAFEKLGSNIAEVKADNLAGTATTCWLALSPEGRENTGVMAPSRDRGMEM